MMSSIGGKSRDSTDFSRTIKPGESSIVKEISESEELYSETEGLRILDEFKKLYENRIDEIDQNSSVPEFERISASFFTYIHFAPVLFIILLISILILKISFIHIIFHLNNNLNTFLCILSHILVFLFYKFKFWLPLFSFDFSFCI